MTARSRVVMRWWCGMVVTAVLCAAPRAAIPAPPLLEGSAEIYGAAPPVEIGEPLVEDVDPGARAGWSLPDPDLIDQLWRPGDLIDDTYFLRRPWHAGFFVGKMDGDDLAPGIHQANDWFGGLRFGNDFAPHWGWEARSAFYSPDLTYSNLPDQRDIAHDWFLDLNVLHYPWGDTRIRPFWSLGLGAAQFKFLDENQIDVSEWVVDLPIAIGCKYQWKPWLTLRGELTDTIILGHENIGGMNNLSLSVGAEVHWRSFGTRPVQYGY